MRNKWVTRAAAAALVAIVAGVGVWKLRKRAQSGLNGDVGPDVQDGGPAD